MANSCSLAAEQAGISPCPHAEHTGSLTCASSLTCGCHILPWVPGQATHISASGRLLCRVLGNPQAAYSGTSATSRSCSEALPKQGTSVTGSRGAQKVFRHHRSRGSHFVRRSSSRSQANYRPGRTQARLPHFGGSFSGFLHEVPTS